MSRAHLSWIELTNFMSFAGTQRFEFANSGMHRIVGANLDYPASVSQKSDVIRNNGAGKSSLLAGVVFGFFGQVPRKINKNRLINKKAKKGMLVSIGFEIDVDAYRIHRHRLNGKNASKLILLHRIGDEWKDVSRADNDKTQEYIEELLQLNFTSFLKTAVMSRDGASNFLEMEAYYRGQVIENIIRSGRFKKLQADVKKDLAEIKKESQRLQIEEGSLSSEAKAYKSTILMTIASGRSRQEKLGAELDAHRRMSSEFMSIDSNVDEAVALVKEYGLIVSNLLAVKTRIASIESAIAEHHKKFKMEKTRRKWHLTHAAKQREHLQHLGSEENKKCPECGFILNKEETDKRRISHLNDIAEHRLKMRETYPLMIEAIEKIRALVLEKEALDVALSALEKQSMEPRFSNVRSFVRENGMSCEQALNEARAIQKKELELIDSIKTVVNQENIVRILKKWRESRRKLINTRLLLGEQKARFKLAEFWDTALDFRNDGSVKSFILAKVVPVFNAMLQNIVNIVFEGKMNVSFDSAFNETVVFDGEEFEYYELSAGERTCLNLCVDFAIFELQRVNFGGFNTILCDEIFTNVDEANVKNLLKILEHNYSEDCAIYVIDHGIGVELHMKPESVVTVEKSNGASKILIRRRNE